MTFEEYLSSLKGKAVGVIGVGGSTSPPGIKKRIWENWGRL